MRKYKIIQYVDGHCTVQVKEGWWPFWQKLWNYGVWDDDEVQFASLQKAEKFIAEDKAKREIKIVKEYPPHQVHL